MALVLSAYDVVVRVSALSAGIEAFARSAPNQTFCTDGSLARVSFMIAADRGVFLGGLKGMPEGSVASVDRHNSSTNAAWLEVGRNSGVDAVWIRGTPPGPLVVPVTWKPGELTFGTPEEMKEPLEYLGIEGSVEVYRDKRTGQKLYAGRTQPGVAPELAAQLEELRQEANGLIEPLMFKEGLGFLEKRRMKKGMNLLEQALASFPENWFARWTLGMCFRALAEHPRALLEFRRAYAANPQHPDVGRVTTGIPGRPTPPGHR